MPDRVNVHLKDRTKGEELWLWRHAAGLTQRAAARRLGVGRVTLQGMERDALRDAPDRAWRLVSKPSRTLLLALARRRSRLSLSRISSLVGASHVTVLRWEDEGDPRLATFWEGRGFIF